MARAARKVRERRDPEKTELREAMDHVQELWRQVWAMRDDNPSWSALVAQLEAAQTRVLALRLKHRL
jgi:hypothetical protein